MSFERKGIKRKKDSSFKEFVKEELDCVNHEILIVEKKIIDYNKDANVDKTALYYKRHCREQELLLKMRLVLEKYIQSDENDDPEEPLSILELSVEQKVDIARRNVKLFTSKKNKIKEIRFAFQRHEIDLYKPNGSKMNRTDAQKFYANIKHNKCFDPSTCMQGEYFTYKLSYNKKTDQFHEQSLFMPYYTNKTLNDINTFHSA